MLRENKVKRCNMIAMTECVNDKAKSPMHQEQVHNMHTEQYTQLSTTRLVCHD